MHFLYSFWERINKIEINYFCFFVLDKEILDKVLGSEERQFSSLAGLVSDKTLRAVNEMGFSEMMEIQFKSIKPLLEGR